MEVTNDQDNKVTSSKYPSKSHLIHAKLEGTYDGKSNEENQLDKFGKLSTIGYERNKKCFKEEVCESNSLNLTAKKKLKNVLVRGTTSIFLPNEQFTNACFKRISISSQKISSSKFPNLFAIQTLQFQKTKTKLRGHSCMINHHGTWKLFFLWDTTLINNGIIFGYMYNGGKIKTQISLLCHVQIIMMISFG